MPVSTCFAASGAKVPSAFALNWMKTWFQISMQRGLLAFTSLAAFGFVVGGEEVEVDFRARAAGAGVAHHPEIVLLVAVDDVDLAGSRPAAVKILAQMA